MVLALGFLDLHGGFVVWYVYLDWLYVHVALDYGLQSVLDVHNEVNGHYGLDGCTWSYLDE